MPYPWGNVWVLLAALMLLFVAAAILFWIVAPRKKKQREFLVTVAATIVKILPDDTDQRGGKHQRLFVRVTNVLENTGRVMVETRRDILIAIRYGDATGLSQRLKILDSGIGKQVELRGKYIPKEHLFGNKDHDVLHYTHKPIGYVRIANKIYR
jgi:hypothetical protein